MLYYANNKNIYITCALFIIPPHNQILSNNDCVVFGVITQSLKHNFIVF